MSTKLFFEFCKSWDYGITKIIREYMAPTVGEFYPPDMDVSDEALREIAWRDCLLDLHPKRTPKRERALNYFILTLSAVPETGRRFVLKRLSHIGIDKLVSIDKHFGPKPFFYNESLDRTVGSYMYMLLAIANPGSDQAYEKWLED